MTDKAPGGIPRISVEVTQDGQRMGLDWYRALSRLFALVEGLQGAGTNTYQTQIDAIKTELAGLENSLASVEARLAVLEAGYHA